MGPTGRESGRGWPISRGRVGALQVVSELVSYLSSDLRGVLRPVGGATRTLRSLRGAGVVEGWVTYREVIRDSVRVRPKHGKRSGGDCRTVWGPRAERAGVGGPLAVGGSGLYTNNIELASLEQGIWHGQTIRLVSISHQS
ncbi:hypothetical protein YC2023_069076 [Brassica napus]